MPKPVDPNRRPQVEIHHYLWSHATEATKPHKQLVLLPADDDHDEDYFVLRDGVTERYIERVTVFERMLERDVQIINAPMYDNLNMGARNPKPSGKALAVMRQRQLRQMILEMTDEVGNSVILNEEVMANMPDADMKFISDALAYLEKPPVPITRADRAEALRNTERGDGPTEPTHIAGHTFRPHDEIPAVG